ncbi:MULTISPECIES: lipopolysaccharide biosynthesis protein [unclassified Streptococcus]|uniref:lipopolysaccharide biosynthesis protein n=1 Tax=unclassified Streptococcus TaxID=2608887 RepID=UPI001072B6D4|nr:MULTISPECIES: hypothetical protein [unclassified Streptococcus]MBF0786621.1 hypothetical protein [Streptococcus sp. 19428wC2_LYSM12]MCQ9212814.1 hypothetical protein [Streptococcus sp. B01]MCQ9214155.1 hypothetical protein [Streptococcus sp. O1]TFV06580.1 hypothetical protein E4T79_01585 [Streptococcus sp. LYSM12]
MNNKLKNVLVNSGYAIFSNLLSMFVSTLVILVLPKLIGVESYGYWQLYLFYVSYVGFFHFGWIDGIYLKYGGSHFEDLDERKFYSQFVMYILFQSVIAFLIFIYGLVYTTDSDKQFIFEQLGITLLLTNVRFFIIYILQTTNRIKQSSAITILDRFLYAVLLIGFILVDINHYQMMIYVDVLARFMSLLYGLYLCRSILCKNLSYFKLDYFEVIDNIKVGSNLMLSNVASLLIIGTVRLGIERQWDIATFGKVSLTLSISNLMMIFINAVGIVIFPMLKRLERGKLSILYTSLRNVLMPFMLGILLLYYPLKLVLVNWLPHYMESIKYMVLIFPMAIYEGKMSLLINTYLKALRMEKYILRVNIRTVCLSLVLTLLTTVVFKNLDLAIVSIVVLLAFRCIVAEQAVARELEIHVKSDIYFEVLLTMVFIVAGWFLPPMIAIILYIVCYGVYLWMKKASLHATVRNLKQSLS